MAFADLPVDLLPLIFQQVLRPQHLAWICMVNKMFHSFAILYLYQRVVIYPWYREGKIRVRKLLWTLANHPRLARYVNKLELRDFPKNLSSTEREDLLELCIRGISNCINMSSCSWTRDGSLNTLVLQSLQQNILLQELEINGHHNHYYDPSILANFTNLRKISLIMPSGEVIKMLPRWLAYTGESLRIFSLVCKSSAQVTDSLLSSIAAHLQYLDELHLAGCPKATHKGVLSILIANITRIKALALEGLSLSFDMATFSEECKRKQLLTHLRSATLAVPISQATTKDWLTNVNELLSDSPLEALQMYSTGGQEESTSSELNSQFLHDLCKYHGDRLVRLAVFRLYVTRHMLQQIPLSFPNLEQLYVSIAQRDLADFGRLISGAQKLRTIHINFTYDSVSYERFPAYLNRELILSIANECGRAVSQFGVQTRVWKVERVPYVKEDDTIDIRVQLAPYDSPDVPGQFLVVRT